MLAERSLVCLPPVPTVLLGWSRPFEGDFLVKRKLPFVAVHVKF